ncbi:MAG: tRNA (guanosine(46)-N7)-methyltransferase TrmB [Clostridia bacterium]|nr:tRNA (guanosine(46)-N7)-methyltransferase TrmB [Clostridia bacterium]
MRMRNKPWAKPELEACDYFIQEPEQLKNRWSEHFAKKQPFYLELGCGKGGFIAQAASQNTDINYLAIDLEFKMLGLARRNVSKTYEEKELPTDNILLTAYNIEKIELIFGEEDLIDRIYINFCNPWPRNKHKKHRLTHPRQLTQYKDFLRDRGEIHFKTDDDELFEESIAYFQECGFEIKYITRDLHTSGYEPNIMTEHEKMFSEEGIKIKFLIAEKLNPLS